MQKKILLLGGSFQQLVAIRTAKEMGLYTILCDYLPDNPGQYEADKYYNISTTDIESVYEVAVNNEVDGILAYASDPAALPAAIVAERLGLPTNPSESVGILGVKHKFRKFLEHNGFACPKHLSFNTHVNIKNLMSDIKDFNFPVIVKPTDSSGSKGVSIIKSSYNDINELESELTHAIKHACFYTRNDILIIEEFINKGFPEVIGGDIFVLNGKIIMYGEMSCLRDKNGDGLIPIGEKNPSGLNPAQKEKVHKELQRIITTLNIRFGELNVEIILDKNDDVHFLELGPRAGGNMIPIQLSDIFDIDLVKANISTAIGETPDLQINTGKPECFMHYVLHTYENGILRDIIFSEEVNIYIYRKVFYKKTGDSVEYFDGAGKALGIVFLKFPNETLMNDFCKRHKDLIKVLVDNINN